MTPEEDPFIDGLVADPADEALRLVHSDWLEENEIRAPLVKGSHSDDPPHLSSYRVAEALFHAIGPCHHRLPPHSFLASAFGFAAGALM